MKICACSDDFSRFFRQTTEVVTTKFSSTEYVDVEDQTDRLMYSYHYTDAEDKLIFRYDNTGHHRKLKLATYPHHKHERYQDNILPSPAPVLAKVLDEIQACVVLP